MLIKHLFFNCLLNELFKNICKSKHNQLILEQILAISIFFLLTIIITFPLIANFANESAGDGCYDKCHMMWRWWWAEFSVENGLDPNYTNYLFHPNGTQLTGNLAQFTTAFAYILLQIFDYTVTWNLIWILSFIFGGYGAFLLANHFNKNFYSSLIAGIIFTFSTYHMTHAGFHIGLSMIVWIPIFILFLFKILEKDSKFYAVLCGFCFFLTSITHLYYSVFIVMFSCIFFLFYIFKQNPLPSGNPDLQLEQGRLTRDVEENQAVYITLRQQYEIAKIEVEKDRLLVNVLDVGESAVKKSKPNRVLITLLSFFGGLSLAVTGVLIQENSATSRQKVIQ